jgi:DNA-binding transcriptional LysR family regulator
MRGSRVYALSVVAGAAFVLPRNLKSPVDLQLPHLETFSKAAEACSFTAAARSLGVTQPAVSQRIRALERMLKTPLFVRRAGRLSLTECGRHLYLYAQRILHLHREAYDKITGCQTALAGELLLAASSIPGEHLLPNILAGFRETYPKVHVRATVLDSLAVLGEVAQGRAHLGLVGRKTDDVGLEFHPLTSDRMVLVVPANHPWRRKRSVSFAQLARQPLVIREPGSGSRWCLEQALQRHGRALHELHVALELGSNETIKEAVQRGLGVAVLSSLAVKKEQAAGQLHTLTVSDLVLDRTVYLVFDRRRALPEPARAMLHFLRVCPGSGAAGQAAGQGLP